MDRAFTLTSFPSNAYGWSTRIFSVTSIAIRRRYATRGVVISDLRRFFRLFATAFSLQQARFSSYIIISCCSIRIDQKSGFKGIRKENEATKGWKAYFVGITSDRQQVTYKILFFIHRLYNSVFFCNLFIEQICFCLGFSISCGKKARNAQTMILHLSGIILLDETVYD